MPEASDHDQPSIDLSATAEAPDANAASVPIWSPEPVESGPAPAPEIPLWTPAQTSEPETADGHHDAPTLESPVPVIQVIEEPVPQTVPAIDDETAPLLPSDPADEAAPAGPSPEVDAKIEELATNLRQLVLSERDSAGRQAWADAAAWAEQHVTTELTRLKAEADERVSQELFRFRTEMERTRAEESARAQQALDATVNQRVEEALTTMSADQTRALHEREMELESSWEARFESALDDRVRGAVEIVAAERVERALEEARAAQQETTERMQAQVEADAAARIQAALADGARAQAAEIARMKAEAEELLAQRFYGGLKSAGAQEAVTSVGEQGDEAAMAECIAQARHEERQAVLVEIDRLRRGMSRLDDARSLGEVLDALGAALRSEISRLAIIKVSDIGASLWQAYGFDPALDPAAVVEDVNQPGVLSRVIENGVPSFVHPPEDGAANRDIRIATLPPDTVGLAVPVLVGGRPVAIAYADDAGMTASGSTTWPEVVGVLARHASRCLDALSALMSATGAEPEPSSEAFDHRYNLEENGGPATNGDGPLASADESARMAERRASPRMGSKELPWLGPVDMQPGHDVSLVNVSDGGALVEAGSRLAPGTSVLLQFIGQEGTRVRGQVLRCAVFTLADGRSVTYRGAVKFSEPLSEFFERAAGGTRELARVEGTVEIDPPVELAESPALTV